MLRDVLYLGTKTIDGCFCPDSTQHYEGCDIITHVNQDCLHMVYFDPQKDPVSIQFQGQRYDLLCKDLVISAIK